MGVEFAKKRTKLCGLSNIILINFIYIALINNLYGTDINIHQHADIVSIY
jgi:hypothetical protein